MSFRSIFAAWSVVVGRFKSLRDKRLDAPVQRMDANDNMIAVPAKTKFGIAGATAPAVLVVVATPFVAAREMTFRAKSKVTDETVVKMS